MTQEVPARNTSLYLIGSILVKESRPPLPGQGSPCERVLVVDDNADTLLTMTDVLLLEGVAEVRVAVSIVEAERILADGFMPSVVLVDLQLDGERGETLITKLRASPTHGAVPIVALSGDYRSLRQLGTTVDRGILKPPDVDDLIAAIRAVCTAT